MTIEDEIVIKVCPFSYMTKKRITAMIVGLWVFAVTVSVAIAINYHVVYVSSLAACVIFDIYPASYFIFAVPEVLYFC